jgi:anti-sigma factor RsiW
MRPDRAPGAAPTDLELMLYADGELDADRIAAVEACLERDAAARAKLAALDLVSGMVRERADGHAAFAVADAVMARIAAEPPAPGPSVVGLLGPAQTGGVAGKVPRPASNDNARGLYLVAAFVVAAAAVVMLWRAPLRGGHGPLGRGVVEDEMAATSPSEAAKHEGEMEHGVEVSSVDFGSANGAIFYVPTGASSTTTVVWLSDDEDDAAGDEP